MRVVLSFLVWCVLFVLAWPVALAALFLLPLIWLLSVPFRLLAWLVEGVLACIKAVLFLPARLLGYQSPA